MTGGNGTKILVRPRKGHIVAGICAGIVGYSGLDVTVVSIFTGATATLAYLAAWLIFPAA
jgi:phage shock protein PspC (stress-responsive transcriptional regulator)